MLHLKRYLIPEVCSSERFWPHLHGSFTSLLVMIWFMLKMEMNKKKHKTNENTQGYCMNPEENIATPSMLIWFKTRKPPADFIKMLMQF